MTSLPDEQFAALVHRGADVVVVRRHLRQRGENVQPRHRPGGGLDAGKLSGEIKQQLLEQLVLQRQQTLAGAQNFVFEVFQVLGDVALGVCQRLLAHEVCGYLSGEGLADLDVVTEHPVEAHL